MSDLGPRYMTRPPLVIPLTSEPRVTKDGEPSGPGPLNLYVYGDSTMTVCELIGGKEVWRSWTEKHDKT